MTREELLTDAMLFFSPNERSITVENGARYYREDVVLKAMELAGKESPFPPAEGAEEIRQLLLGWEHYKRDHFRESEALDVEAILMSEYSQIAAQQPTAEGAEEIDELIKKHIPINAANFEFCVKHNLINGFLLQGIRDVATLHAQKMARENLREELIDYDKWLNRTRWGIKEILSPEKAVERYLKSK